jgi:hypothetical protein
MKCDEITYLHDDLMGLAELAASASSTATPTQLDSALARLNSPPAPEQIEVANYHHIGVLSQMVATVNWFRGLKSRGEEVVSVDALLQTAEQILAEELELTVMNKPELFRRIAITAKLNGETEQQTTMTATPAGNEKMPAI